MTPVAGRAALLLALALGSSCSTAPPGTAGGTDVAGDVGAGAGGGPADGGGGAGGAAGAGGTDGGTGPVGTDGGTGAAGTGAAGGGGLPCPPDAVAPPAPPAEECLPGGAGVLQDVRGTPAGPYLLRHPAEPTPDVPTIVYLPGGTGSSSSAQRVWQRFLVGDPRVDGYRVVLPYSDMDDFIDDADRTFRILDEVLGCWGGDPRRVHLAGYSNGGLAAFGLMLERPDRFATLLGSPGLFLNDDADRWVAALACRSIFLGVGELDEWRPDVLAVHETLVARGVDSTYVEFAGEAHRISDAFDEGVLFDFWAAHRLLDTP